MGPRHDLSFCAGTTACLESELRVSMGPRPLLWFLISKQRILVQNYKSLWFPAHICGFCKQNSDFWTRTTSVYGSQISPVVLCIQTSVISTRITCLYWCQPSSVVLESKQHLLDQKNKSLLVSDLTCRFVPSKHRD